MYFVGGAGGFVGVLEPAQADVGCSYCVELVVDAMTVGAFEPDAESIEPCEQGVFTPLLSRET